MNLDLPLFKIVQRPLLPIAESWVDATPLVFLVLLLLLSLRVSRHTQRPQLARRVIQVATAFVLIIFLHRCMCALRGWAFALKMLGRNDLIAFGHACIFVVLTSFAMAYGRHFCGWMCPIGFFQELLGKLSLRRQRLPDRRRLWAGYLLLAGLLMGLGWLTWLVRPSTQYWSENIASTWGLSLLLLLFFMLPRERRDWRLRWLKYVSAGAYIGIAALGVFVNHPWCVLYGNEMDYSSLVGLLSVMAATLVVSMAYCRYLCPVGGLLAACSHLARFKIANRAACNGCGLCETLCPTGALKPGAIERSSCIYCGKCVGTCGFYWHDRVLEGPQEFAPAEPPRRTSPVPSMAGPLLFLLTPGLLLLSTGPLSAGEAIEWPTFHYDNARTGRPPISFPSAHFKLQWTYSPGLHTWKYCEGVSIWSASPIVAEVEGRLLVITGAYDHNVYALEGRTGKLVWRFTTGCVVNAAPAFARIDHRPLVFVGSGDRCFYCLDARSGQKVWVRETMPWSFTVGESVPSSPLVAWVNNEPIVFVAFWNSDKRPVQTVQRGDLFAFRARDGKLLWERKLTTGQICSPAAAKVGGRWVLYLGTEDGVVLALDAATGSTLWDLITDHAITNSPTIAHIAGQPVVYVGNFFGMLYCLHGRTGKILWKEKLGHEIRSTAAFAQFPAGPLLFVGAFDRCLYAIQAKDTNIAWRFTTGKYLSASPVIVDIAGKPAVLFSSLDNFLYVLDALDGSKLWTFQTGDMLWPYEKRGASLWSSPVVAQEGQQPLLFFGGHDGKMYCFAAAPEGKGGLEGSQPPRGNLKTAQEAARQGVPRWGTPAVWIPFALAAVLIVAGTVLILSARNYPHE